MLYAGLDVHRNKFVLCVLDEEGRVVRRTTERSLEGLVGRLVELDRFEVAFEASTGYGVLHERLRRLAVRVVVAHPGKLNWIFRSRRKNDRFDAEKLARMLHLGALPAVHVPPVEVRTRRETIGFRRRLVQRRTGTKNQVRNLLRTLSVEPPRRPGLWSRRGLEWLARLEFEQPLHALRRDVLLDQLALLGAQLQRVERELDRIANDDVAVARLRSIPGVGPRTAEALVAFVDDPHRFPNAKAVGAYFGLVPSQDQSNRVNRLGHLTKEGSAVVRHLVTEAAWQAVRLSPTFAAFYERIRRGDPNRRKIAIVATAHYLVRVAWALLIRGTLWRENDALTTAA